MTHDSNLFPPDPARRLRMWCLAYNTTHNGQPLSTPYCAHRHQFMAEVIADTLEPPSGQGHTLIGVVGAAHLEGIEGHLQLRGFPPSPPPLRSVKREAWTRWCPFSVDMI